MSAEESEFDRGHRLGKMAQELHEHAEHLSEINGSMGKLADRMAEMIGQGSELLQAIARIDQAMTADKETVRQTAAALRDQADVASKRDEGRWTPFSRALVALSTLAGLVGVLYVIFH